MLERKDRKGYFIAVDGPNGVGKSTLIKEIKNRLESLGYEVCGTREPTNTALGDFLRKYAEEHSGISVACLVAANRYEHLSCEIIPALEKGQIVITDRYVLSSLILQEMDGVSNEFVLNLNAEILKPDLQLAVFADEGILQKRLAERESLTRFEMGNQSERELFFMKRAIEELKKQNVDVMNISNNGNLKENVEKVVSYIMDNWRTV